jgi:hypothetical protein
MRKLVVLVFLAVTLLLVAPAVASASTPTLKSLAKSLAALQKTVKSQTASIHALQSKSSSQAATIAALRSTVATQASTISSLQGVVGTDASHGLRKSVADIAGNPVMTLSWLPTYVTLDSGSVDGVAGPNVTFSGCNVHVRSTTGEADASGLGNLIVGWNEAAGGDAYTMRFGSNNLVCGDYNYFTSYGCFISGSHNSGAGAYSGLNGGWGNSASGVSSSVAGGEGNAAQGEAVSITGGESQGISTPCEWSAGGAFHNP